jgi:hypothetical protein
MNLRSKKQNYTILQQNIGRRKKPKIKRCGKHSHLRQSIDIFKRDYGMPEKANIRAQQDYICRENETKKALEWNRPE